LTSEKLLKKQTTKCIIIKIFKKRDKGQNGLTLKRWIIRTTQNFARSEILNYLTEGNTYENKETVCLVNGDKKRFNLNVYPIKNSENTIAGMAAVFKDMRNVYDLVNKYTGMTATYTADDIIGESAEILAVKEKIKKISNSPSTVLIQGESGTGKELIAQAIHNSSSRRNNSFIAINCGAIPENLIESELFGYDEGAFTGGKKGGHPGKFEFANGGTLFLDEIGEMPLDMQVSLLRVLQEGYVTRLGGNKCSFHSFLKISWLNVLISTLARRFLNL
jgi:transcriptional regulator with PAS, ATPase and Fis domain